jgi:hypothetical protein
MCGSAINNLSPDVRLRRLLKAKERQSSQSSSGGSSSSMGLRAGIKSVASSSDAAAKLSAAAERAASRRSTSGPRWQAGGVSTSCSGTHCRTDAPVGTHSPPASEASSSHSDSTAYYSVASSMSASKQMNGSGASAGLPQPSACFEV